MHQTRVLTDTKLTGGGAQQGSLESSVADTTLFTSLPKCDYPFLRYSQLEFMVLEVILFSLSLFFSFSDRSCFQQWRNMEANPAFFPHGFAEYGHGKEDY